MKKKTLIYLIVLLLIGSFAGCNHNQGDNTEPATESTTVPTTIPTIPTETTPNYKNVLYHKNMSPQKKESFIRFLYKKRGIAQPFYEDGFGYGLFYLGTINGWDIIFYNPLCITEFGHPDMVLGTVQFEGSCENEFLACNGIEAKRLVEVYKAGEFNDEPLEHLKEVYLDAYQQKQTITIIDEWKGSCAFRWLHWDLVGNGEKFQWRSYPEDVLPWGLLPDEVIEGRLQPGEWTE